MSKNILILEQDPAMRARFKAAFALSGYHVLVTDMAAEAFTLLTSFDRSKSSLDLVVVDLSDDRYRGFIADALRLKADQAILTLKDAGDKSFIIDQLSANRHDFIDCFVRTAMARPEAVGARRRMNLY